MLIVCKWSVYLLRLTFTHYFTLQEELILKFGAFDLRKIASYPSHAKTLRGVGGDVLYLEEAAFLDMAGKFYSVLASILRSKFHKLTLISLQPNYRPPT